MKKILVILSILLLVGCESSPRTKPKPRWYKVGVSRAETNEQLASCVYNVGMNKVDPMKERNLIRACMLSKGFRWGVPKY